MRPYSSSRHPGPPPSPSTARDEPDLLVDVRRALGSGEPLDLLSHVSTMVAVVDPRAKSPITGGQSRAHVQIPSLEELSGSFISMDCVETSAMLAVIAELTADEVLRARIRRELDRRNDPLPGWLRRLGEARPHRAAEVTHVLRDGHNVMLGAQLPDGHELSIVVYIDHNLGTVAKDAFVLPGPIDELIDLLRTTNDDDPDTEWSDLDLPDAKVRIAEAIAIGAITFPPYETETWPGCRPIVEWVNRLLPDGGTGYDRPDWSEEEKQELAARFFASPFGAALDDEDHHDLLDGVLWFGTDYGPGDPLRWSPVAVEILLADWLPRKIFADEHLLSKAPELLRAFIAFCHDERGIRPALTRETIIAIDEFEPGYQRAIGSPRPQGSAALLTAIGALDPDGPWDTSDTLDPPWSGSVSDRNVVLARLGRVVGGLHTLETLDDHPLPDEDFDWHGVSADIRPKVEEVLELCDACCEVLLDRECRTACRRLLARVAIGDPNVFRRKGRTSTAAAAVCWIIGKANDLFDPYPGGLQVKSLMSHFGTQQTVSQRAGTMLRAAGFDTHSPGGVIVLGSPDFLVSQRRRHLIDLRDRYAEIE